MGKLFLALGAGFGLLGVILGAFATHSLRARLSSDMLAIFRTGVEYQFYHVFALLVVGVLALMWPQRALLGWSGALFCVGIVVFSGSLYLLSTTGTRWLGAITPFGGVSFIVGWLLLLIAVVRHG